jgi:hypothetical protein
VRRYLLLLPDRNAFIWWRSGHLDQSLG